MASRWYGAATLEPPPHPLPRPQAVLKLDDTSAVQVRGTGVGGAAGGGWFGPGPALDVAQSEAVSALEQVHTLRGMGIGLLALLYPSPIPLVPPTSPQPRLRITPPISHTRTHCLHSSSYGATTGRVSRPNAMPNPSLWPHPSPTSPNTNPNPNHSCGTSITPNCSRKPGVGR